MATTWMCDNSNHGTAERRYLGDFKDMYTGKCAGTVVHLETREQEPCGCHCHNAPEPNDMYEQFLYSSDGPNA